jgi:hypothetical protein
VPVRCSARHVAGVVVAARRVLYDEGGALVYKQLAKDSTTPATDGRRRARHALCAGCA